MKQLILILSLFLFVLVSCQEEEEILYQATGIVVDHAGSGNCGIVIELDNGNKVIPMYYPEEHTFVNGQRVAVDYYELNRVTTDCHKGIACEIKYVEELACAPYTDLYFENYDSLARDPIHIHEAYVDGDCLYFKVSYSGGCQNHTIDLIRLHSSMTGEFDLPIFEISHNSNNDLCEGWFTQKFRYDLKILKEGGKKEFILTAKLLDGKTFNKVLNLEQD